MTNFLPTLTSKLPSVMQETAVDSLSVVTGITQEQLTAAVDAAVKSSTEAINGDMGMLWMLLSGILVFFMQAGFTLVESGMTRSKNAVNIAMKNLLDICVGSLTYWIIGYSLMYGDTSNGWFFLEWFISRRRCRFIFPNDVCCNSCNDSFRSYSW